MTHPAHPAAWLRSSLRAARPEIDLVCLPHAGGAASSFRNWQASMPSEIGVLAVQYPGHEGRWREPLARDLDDIVMPLTDAVVARGARVALFGHSLGALIAFDVARALRKSGRPHPIHLFVSGSRAPDTPPLRRVHDLPEAALLAFVCGLGGIPDEVVASRVLMDALLPLIREGLRLDETYAYRPEPPLDCPITAFFGEADPEVTREQVESWGRQTRGAFRLVPLAAAHFWSPRCEAEVAADVGRALREAGAHVCAPAQGMR